MASTLDKQEWWTRRENLDARLKVCKRACLCDDRVCLCVCM